MKFSKSQKCFTAFIVFGILGFTIPHSPEFIKTHADIDLSSATCLVSLIFFFVGWIID